MKYYHPKTVFTTLSKDTRDKAFSKGDCFILVFLTTVFTCMSFCFQLRKNMEGILDKSVVDCLLTYCISNNV